jgi:hypothetical protein
VNRSGSSQKEMTKDGVGGKAFRAKRMCPSFGRVWLAFGGSSFGYGSVMLRRVLVPLSVAVLALTACGGSEKFVVDVVCLPGQVFENENGYQDNNQKLGHDVVALLWSDGSLTTLKNPKMFLASQNDVDWYITPSSWMRCIGYDTGGLDTVWP